MRPGAGQGLGSWPGAQAQTQGMGLTECAGTWLSVLNHFPSSDSASLDQVNHWKPDPPAVENDWKFFIYSDVSHTRTQRQTPHSNDIEYLSVKQSPQPFLFAPIFLNADFVPSVAQSDFQHPTSLPCC